MSVNYSLNPSRPGDNNLYDENDMVAKKRRDAKKINWFNYIYDPREQTFLGRTPKNWGVFILFLFVFYLVLALYSFLLMILFLEGTVNEDVPKMRGAESIIELKPGLSIRPIVDFKTTMIRYITSDAQTYANYVQHLRAFTEIYEMTNIIDNIGFTSCPYYGLRGNNDPLTVCKFRLAELGDCQRQNNFGFDRNKPCIIIKINRVYGWLPDIINTTVPFPLVECSGQNEADWENFGELAYYPNVTFNNKVYGVYNTHFYPFLTQSSYRQPLVAVQFLKPKRNIVLMVNCRVVNVRNVQEKGVNFELLVD